MSDKETIAVYTNRLESYLKIPLPEEQLRSRKAFAQRVGTGAYVLDLGSGPGSDSAFMMRAGLRVRALDATPAFVTAARDAGVDAHLGTFDDLTEVDTYDGIYASFSLLHAPRCDFARYIGAIRDALKPGGVLFLGLKLGTGEGRDELGRFYTYFSRDEIENTLAEAGFVIEDVTTGMGTGLAGTYDGFILVLAHA